MPKTAKKTKQLQANDVNTKRKLRSSATKKVKCKNCNETVKNLTHHLKKCMEIEKRLPSKRKIKNLDDKDDSNLKTKSTSQFKQTNQSKDNATTRDKNNDSIFDFEPDDSDADSVKSGEKVLNKNENSVESIIDRSLMCQHCHEMFANPIEKLRHTRECHQYAKRVLSLKDVQKYFDLEDRSFCPICRKPIKTRNYKSIFIKHLMVHTAGVSFECGVCGQKFRRRDHMKVHEKRHIVVGGGKEDEEEEV